MNVQPPKGKCSSSLTLVQQSISYLKIHFTFLSFCREQLDLPGDEDSEGGIPRSSLARNSCETAADPPSAQIRLGEATSHSPRPTLGAGGGIGTPMAEVHSSVVEETTEDQVEKIPSGREEHLTALLPRPLWL